MRRHPLATFEPGYADVWVGIIELPSTRVYSCAWRRDAEDAPLTEEEVLTAWRDDRKAFVPGYCWER